MNIRVEAILKDTKAAPDDANAHLRALSIVELQNLRAVVERLTDLLEQRLRV